MHIVDIREAKTRLSELIDRACAGEEVVIQRNGAPVVRLAPIYSGSAGRMRGSLEGQVIVPDSFFHSLPPEELEAWE